MLAVHLARQGHHVVALARSSPDLETLVEEATGSHLVAIATDVTDSASVRGAFETAAAQLGPPENLITCAGSADAIGPVVDVDPDRWWAAVATDVRGTMLTAQAALQLMLPTRRGRIVTVYGNLGDRGAPNLSAFASAKAAVARFTEVVASEVKEGGVAVLGMHPGFVRTPMTEQLAWSATGRRWLPTFGDRAERHWGDGRSAAELIDRITAGEADQLTGRIVHAGDDLARLAKEATNNPDLRRLRLHLSS